MKSARRRAREFALQGLYQWQLSANPVADIEAHVRQVAGFDKADGPMFDRLLRGTVDAAASLRELLAPFLDRRYEELSPVERGVLLLAAFELSSDPETPYRVVLNEAIELAKAYGAADGHRFVNGVLDKLAARLRPAEVGAEGANGYARSSARPREP